MAVFRPRRQNPYWRFRQIPSWQARRRWVPGGAYGGTFDLGLVILTTGEDLATTTLSPSAALTAIGSLTAHMNTLGPMIGDTEILVAPYNPASVTERG